MSNQPPATTVDSLFKFSHKKKFSFANKNPANCVEDVTNSESETSSDEDNKPDVNGLNKSPWKGSARLKEPKNSSSDSEAEKKTKKHKKKKKSEKDPEDKLNRLTRMFPDYSLESIKIKFAETNFNAKKCVDLILREKEKKQANKSLEIEEWSDGDENIRAKNIENKLKRLSNESDDVKKRKSINNEELIEPLKKKARKLILESDDDEETNSVGKQQSLASTSNSTKTSTSSLQSNDETEVKAKTSKKKLIIKSSSEDNEEEEEEEKKSKKSKKKKKDKEKKKKKVYGSDNEYADQDQDDDDFNRSEASGGDDSDDEGDKISEVQQAAILSLFNDAPLLDIQSMINISTKKLQTLLSLRPFENFKDLRSKLAQKSLINVIYSAKDIIHARSIVSNLLAKCEKISEKMEKQVTSLIETSEDTNAATNSMLEIKFQPKILNKNLSLKPYQLIGLNWLCLMHKENINAILADEMGLGKTCQTISFLAHLLETNKKLMHLIIVPPSTLDNWIREISTWCPDFNFTVYQGGLEERKHLRFDILNNKFEKPLNGILTTYGLISSTNEDKAFFKKLKVEYCVFDEAHMLKNMNSIRYQALIKIQSRRKLLLTGTPLQNNLVELMSLLYFTMPDVFQNRTQYVNKIFSAKPSNVDVDTFYNEKIAQAKGIMKPFILRRLKTEVLKQLPQKIEEIIFCDMSTRQEKEYNNLIAYYKKRKDELLSEQAEKTKLEKEKKTKTSTAPSKMEEILEIMNNDQVPKKKTDKKENEDNSSNILMELRKAANHPLLRRVIYDNDKLKQMARLVMKESPPGTVYEYVLEDMSVMSDFQLHKLCPLYKCLKGFELKDQDIIHSGKFTVLDSLLQEKKESGDRVLIFSQFVIMLDIVEDFLKLKKYKYFRLDGGTAISERQDMIDEYNNDREIFIFLLSTKAGGVGINLTAANVVILHDIDFNPFNDKQAEDRCHRVGQTKEVQVYKLISKNTIDETMLKIQRKKLDLGADISGENDDSQSKSDMVSMLKEALKL